jgi:uncharacterized protein
MTRPSTARAFALLTLPVVALSGMLLGCTEPSGTAGTIDAPPPAVIETASPQPASGDEVPSEDAAILAAGDPAAEAQPPGTAEAAVEAEPAAPEEPVVLEPRRVLIVGSSLAATGFGAVLEDMLDEHPDIECFRKAKSASGLVRPDFFDWDDQSKRQVEFRKPDLVIVFMGANDGQDIPAWQGSGRVGWGDEDWPAAYRTRVDDFLGNLTMSVEGQDGADVLWLALPKMPSPSLERKLTVIRGVHEQAVGALGAHGSYLDTTQYLVDANGQLMVNTEVRGKQREIRSEDGVHFTMSGCEYLADKIYPEVLTRLGLPAEPSK